ncbi:hypothetical protein GFY24_18305 [Nocardia sp. SYP-A9097]|uniref:hypothetical protein n=1 Tax=Nocardia sp. SYP-A9097 TaxID=2663237 RepID=UPI00129BACEB|nr:hypothetical protein [Nocardia sp. SYP-A9097]MRH89377.1 hypothetical protein [Nocardia sp. SYP-A9097]
MAVDPNVSDNTAWATLPGNGELMLSAGIAEKCARYVEDMLNVVVGVHTWVQQNAALASPVIATPLVSADLLRTVYLVKIGTEFMERMDRHRNILVDMGNTFVAAGKRYELTEHTSAVSFDGISFDNPVGTPPSGAPKPVAIPTHPRKPKSGTQFDGYSFGPEMGSQLGWQTLYLVGNSIESQAVANAGGVWYWLSQTLDTGFETLRSTISSASGEWIGQGAQSAILATNQYAGASQQLTGDMNLLGDSLVYTSGWLQQTKNGMPQTPDAPPATTPEQQAQNQSDLIEYQDNFQTYYSENYTHVTTHIVALPQPDQVTSPADDAGDPPGDVPAQPFTDGDTPPDGGPSPDNTGGDSHNPPSDNGGDGGGGGGDTNPGGHSPSNGETPSNGNTPPGSQQPGSSEPQSGTPRLPTSTENNPALTDLSTKPTEGVPAILGAVPPNLTAGAGPLGGKGGFGGRGGLPSLLAQRPEAKLFPRATLPPQAEMFGRAGPGTGRGSGFPMGGVPGQVREEGKEKKKSEYLNSDEYLDEALGGPGRGVKPVLDR